MQGKDVLLSTATTSLEPLWSPVEETQLITSPVHDWEIEAGRGHLTRLTLSDRGRVIPCLLYLSPFEWQLGGSMAHR